ncbi:XkdQ/YqbQ family protein [Sporomusa sphaeroides]|uniref:YqbQ/XkdQ domain-containing protein n=1 Tax=Sporomusa sphaeroides DSM 2875 TaxID=1337886 RepID=A0ABM9W0Q7_9FIRM|nr:hydrolase [Sporomusa sphaeroides]OLS58273.1 hypothetical protein SPSPH_18090 [Sporomusa sphaeroides DSM 2875]CVK17540.1 hypothetical protein SSPH_00174 [Sporomusa sphaeroides DSM 2875]
MNDVQILINNGGKLYEPIVEEGISWETTRKGAPGKLTFNVLVDNTIDFTEGNAVRMAVDGTDVFYGYVFTKKRDKDGIIQVTAYDQLRYLKNKHTMHYERLTASELIKKVAAIHLLKVGEIEDTEYVIEKRVEDNQTLFDIIQEAIGITLENKKKLYVLYDDFGKLTLKNIESMKLDLLIDAETGENFDYVSSIDHRTFNRVKLYRENKDTGKHEVFTAPQDPEEFTASESIKKWGVLQYCEKIDEGVTNPQAMADALLEMYNRKTRSLSINNAFGDIRVRAGSHIAVQLALGDITVNKHMLVEGAKHVFTNRQHTMNLSLRSSEFNA